MKSIILKLIKMYQVVLSPDHGLMQYFKPFGTCKFRPTCSEYMYTAIDRYGILFGSIKGIKRLLRCRPFSCGGYDPVK